MKTLITTITIALTFGLFGQGALAWFNSKKGQSFSLGFLV